MMLLQLAADHPVWTLIALLIAVPSIAIAGLILATREPKSRHRGRPRSQARAHQPRHAAGRPQGAHKPRHEVAQSGAVELGRTVDGDITLVHATLPAEPAVEVRADDEPTVQLDGALAGAA